MIGTLVGLDASAADTHQLVRLLGLIGKKEHRIGHIADSACNSKQSEPLLEGSLFKRDIDHRKPSRRGTPERIAHANAKRAASRSNTRWRAISIRWDR